MFPPGLKTRREIEHCEALAHTLVAYTTILCCVDKVKRGVLHPLGETLVLILTSSAIEWREDEREEREERSEE